MKQEIKDIFQNSFEQADTTVDTQALLAGIAKKRKSRKRRRVGFWIFPVGLLLLSVTIITIQTNKSDSDTVASLDKISLERSEENSMTTITKANTEEVSLEGSLEEIELESSRNIPNNVSTKESAQAFITDELTGLTNETEVTRPSSTKNIDKKIVESNVRSIVRIQKNESSYFGERLPPAEQKTMKAVAIELNSTKQEESSEIEIINSDGGESDVIAMDSSEQQKETNEIVEVASDKNIEISKTNTIIDETKDQNVLIENAVSESEEKNSLLDHFAIKFLVSGNKATSTYGTEPLGIMREASMSSALGYSVQLGGEMIFNNGLSLGIGLDYDRNYALFEWKGEFVVDVDGDYVGSELPQNIVSSNFLYTKKERHIKKYRSRSFMDLPVSVGIQKSFGKFTVSPAILFAFNLSQSQKGYTLNENVIPEQLDGDSVDVSPALGCALDLSYGFRNNFEFVTRISYSRRELNDGLVKEVVRLPKFGAGIRYVLK